MSRSWAAFLVVLTVGLTSAWADDEPPVPLNGRGPDYPARAREEDVEGVVRYRVLVSERGEVSEVEILAVPKAGLGFEEEARDTLENWRFRPAIREGVAAAAWYEGTFDFTLTHPDSLARMYPLSAGKAWKELVGLLHELEFQFETFDESAGVIVTRWRRFPSKSLPALERPDWRPALARSFQLYLFLPQCAEPARLYVGTMVRGGAPRGQSRAWFNSGHVEKWLYSMFESRIGASGHAIPRNSLKRRDLEVRLWPQAAERDCGPVEPQQPNFLPPSLIASTKISPIYPENARLERKQGKVLVEATVYEDGWVGTIHALSYPESRPEFAVSAVHTVSFWRYRPMMLNGCPVPIRITVVVDYTLK